MGPMGLLNDDLFGVNKAQGGTAWFRSYFVPNTQIKVTSIVEVIRSLINFAMEIK